MANTFTSPSPVEPHHSHHAHLLCWKSVIAGVFISIMSYLILAALGAGVVGSAAQSVIEHEKNGSALATGSGLWLGLSAVISLFLGSYFTVRMSKSQTNKMGAAHGFVVASVFFILLVIEAGSVVGGLAQGLGHLAAGLGEGTASLSASPMVQDTIQRALGTQTLKADPKLVMEGLTVRLLQGDVESAKSYYAYQTGLSGAEVDTKIAQLKTDFDQAAKTVGEKAARAASDLGWSLFVTFLVGLVGALIGGRVGAHANIDRPLVVEASRPVRPSVLATERGSMVPYLFGWLLGVPTSILFLIFILRSVF